MDDREEVVEEVVVRFANLKRPDKADQMMANLSAVCCPSFSLA